MLKISTLFCICALTNISTGDINNLWEKAQSIPVEYKGRTRPFEAATQDIYLQFSGKKTLPKISTTQWFCKLSDDSDTTLLFLIPQSSVKDALRLQLNRRKFSYKEIVGATIKDTLPLSSTPIEYSLLKMRIEEIYEGRSSLQPATQQGIINLYNNLCIYEQILEKHIISSWSSIHTLHQYNPQTPFYETKYFTETTDSVFATYKDVLYLKKSLLTYNRTKDTNYVFPSTGQTELELYYIKINPIRLFLLASLTVFLMLLLNKKRGAFVFAFPSLFLITEFIFRAVILQRFPIASLYETTLFSSLLILLYGYFKSPSIFLLITSLLLERAGFIFSAEKSLEPISPQLQNSFWLSTHVTLIILGMSLHLIKSLKAHITLLSQINKTKINGEEDKLLAGGFITLFCGTIIGSLWAKESWGRYWAWDPKEIGALLLLIYSFTLLVYRRSSKTPSIISEFLTALIVPLILTIWFGLNTLSTSMHSYGYTENGVFTFITLLLVEIGILFYILIQIKKAA